MLGANNKWDVGKSELLKGIKLREREVEEASVSFLSMRPHSSSPFVTIVHERSSLDALTQT